MNRDDPFSVRAFVAIHTGLTRLCPRAFRQRFTDELRQTATQAARDASRRRALVAFALPALFSVVTTAVRLRLAERRAHAPHLLRLVVAPALLAAGIGWLDLRSTEVQPIALALVVVPLLLTSWRPRSALLWWLMFGGAIPAAHAIARLSGVQPPYDVAPGSTLLALVPAGLGVVSGLVARAAWRGRAGQHASG